MVDRRYVFTRFKAENDLSLIALVADITRISLAIFTTWESNVFWELSKRFRKEMRSSILNFLVS